MPAPVPRDPAPSATDGDGLRIVPVATPARSSRVWLVGLGVLGLLAALVLWRGDRSAETGAPASIAPQAPVASQGSSPPRALSELKQLPRAMRAVPAPVAAATETLVPEPPSNDPDDLAMYFSPGDAEPTMGELIEALNDAGVRTGIAAFNPPGTSPPLSGIRVPDDYVLPPGYVRHYQVTDQGEPIDPILMFAPDFAFFDDDGRPVAIPENRVVPPELVPPGLVVDIVDVPPP